MWFHITNPYADISIVEQPYTTSVVDSKIILDKQFDLQVLSSEPAALLGYYKSGFLIAQSALRPSVLTDTKTESEILDEIHQLRFDPDKPYLITGNQFSALYPRNLGVFYNSLLDPTIAPNQEQWEKRQQIYLLSAMYALDAFSSEQKITTTIVPIGKRTVALTQVHPGATASDALYGMMYAFYQLSGTTPPGSAYDIQTQDTVRMILRERRDDFNMLVDLYLKEVQDPNTGLIKRSIKLSGARDGVTRDSSFFDNVVMWSTIDMAHRMGVSDRYTQSEIDELKTKIINTYWDDSIGIFSDQFPTDTRTSEFSADWLIALPTGMLQPDNPEDMKKLERIVRYTQKNNLDEPLPIKYTNQETTEQAPLAVRWFVPNYGGSAIWSYWGGEYLSLLNDLYEQTGNERYLVKSYQGLQAYRDRIERYGGFPETFNPDGTFLETFFYESIIETGWVVQYEHAVLAHQHNTANLPSLQLDEPSPIKQQPTQR